MLPPPPPPPVGRSDQVVSVVEIATVAPMLDGDKVTEVIVAEADKKTSRKFVEVSESDDESDAIFLDRKELMMVDVEDDEEILYDEVEDYYASQVFENPEN